MTPIDIYIDAETTRKQMQTKQGDKMRQVIIDGVEYIPKKQIKSLLADAKVGDLCQTRGEGYHLISDVYTDQRQYAYERNCGDTIYVCENGMFNLTNHEHPFDIIHTEPLAPEGSAEWAWQMLILQKPVSHPAEGIWRDTYYSKDGFVRCMAKTGWQLYEEKPETAKEPEIVSHKQHANCLVCGKVIEGLLDGHATVSIKRYSISSLYESTYSHYCGKCFLELGFDATERELRNRQLYEEKPETAKEQFEVGDWVEFRDIEGIKHGIIEGRREEYSVLCNGVSQSVGDKFITRKLNPSEIVLDFGNGIRGTIRRYRGEQIRIYDGDINFACLAISYVTEPMQTTVRKLLAAIEEEKTMRERMRICPLCGYPMDACDYSPIYGYSWFHPKSETSALCKYSEKLIWDAHLEKSSTGGLNDIPRN